MTGFQDFQRKLMLKHRITAGNGNTSTGILIRMKIFFQFLHQVFHADLITGLCSRLLRTGFDAGAAPDALAAVRFDILSFPAQCMLWTYFHASSASGAELFAVHQSCLQFL